MDVVIVDDDKNYSAFFKKLLESIKLEVCVYNDPEELFTSGVLNKSPVVLLDIIMPDTSGIEVLKRIRKDYELFQVPVIMVSAKSENQDVVESLEFGASDYLIKPANIKIAKARIDTQLELVRLHKRSLADRELESVKSLIATYNHELNNPLTIALGFLTKLKAETESDSIAHIEKSLKRIREIVKKIDKISHDNIEYDSYTDKSKIIKL